MSIYKYDAFLKTIEFGSITKAAEELGYTQPGLSHVLSSLETDLGVKILFRDRSGVYLNQTGEALIPYIRTVCEAENQLRKKISEIQNESFGCVKLGVFTSVATHVIPDILIALAERNPNVAIQLFHGTYEEIEEWIRQGKVDTGFILDPPRLPLKTYPIKNDRTMVIMPHGHPLEFSDVVEQKELLNYPYILYGGGNWEDHKRVEVFDQLKKNAKYTVNDDNAVFAMVEKGLGIALVPELVLKKTSYCIAKRELFPPAYRTIALAVREEDNLSPFVKQFINHIIYANSTKDLW